METSHFQLPGTPSESVRHSETQDGAVLLDIRQGVCFSINPVGSRIWNMLKEEQSFDSIVDRLAAEFMIPRQQLCSDVMEFTTALHKRGLLLSGAERATKRPGAFRNAIQSFKKLRGGCQASACVTGRTSRDRD